MVFYKESLSEFINKVDTVCALNSINLPKMLSVVLYINPLKAQTLFLLLRCPVVCTVESLSLFYLFHILVYLHLEMIHR